ncbi:ZIP-like iron-zinc transporter [Pisolithus croceorrhizus]|nr:ZIP-like iron-zinc transporter [Pisolithus croceorrhizus]KAI6110672.1 ZIP-like iron-zinc transporter [Pisolithus croceorrhizus]KAI6159855.1 ZIP-like iron-zinc transporter [Pisolithus thermaeus]
MSSSDINCGSGGGADTYTGLRIASVFVILVGSGFGALFPVLARRSSWLRVPEPVYEFAKYFGSGVIIATAFIHLLSSGISELSSPCLSPAWQIYPYALAFSMLSLFCIFVVELVAFRWGTAKLAALGIVHDAHGHGVGSHAAHGPEAIDDKSSSARDQTVGNDLEVGNGGTTTEDNVLAQMIGVFILEFGVLLHSLLIGLTLAVDANFITLFVVVIFHQLFEGLGIGSRLSVLNLSPRYSYIPVVGGILYAITTPIGIAAGLGVRSTYNPNSTTASIVSGIMDSLSSGILLYTGLVELLAHEFLFNNKMINASIGKVTYAVVCMLFGTGIMALLGRWA